MGKVLLLLHVDNLCMRLYFKLFIHILPYSASFALFDCPCQLHNSFDENEFLAPGSDVILSCSDDSTIKVWNLAAGSLAKTLRWHKLSVRCIDAKALSSGAKSSSKVPIVICSCGLDKTIQIHNFSDVLINKVESCCNIS